ncbi:hypothetical protein D9M68_649330 [compost metagenome]
MRRGIRGSGCLASAFNTKKILWSDGAFTYLLLWSAMARMPWQDTKHTMSRHGAPRLPARRVAQKGPNGGKWRPSNELPLYARASDDAHGSSDRPGLRAFLRFVRRDGGRIPEQAPADGRGLRTRRRRGHRGSPGRRQDGGKPGAAGGGGEPGGRHGYDSGRQRRALARRRLFALPGIAIHHGGGSFLVSLAAIQARKGLFPGVAGGDHALDPGGQSRLGRREKRAGTHRAHPQGRRRRGELCLVWPRGAAAYRRRALCAHGGHQSDARAL